jgi:hypothetical protein
MRRTFTLAAGLALWAAAAWALPQPLVDLDLMPDYQLPGNAAFPAPEPAAPPVIEMPPSEAPAFMGLEPTETRAVDVRASDFAYSGVTIEMWLLDHVNQPVGAVLSAAEPGEEPSWLLGYSEEQAVLSADGRLLESGAQEAWKGRWYHVAATYDGYSARLYVNGELAASQPLMDADPPAGRARITLTGYFGHEPRMELGNLLYGFRMYALPLTRTRWRASSRSVRNWRTRAGWMTRSSISRRDLCCNRPSRTP